jgi:hypothetical protein
LLQAASFTQLPAPLQVWGCWPTHWCAPGVQVPEQEPPVHTLGQGVSLCQAPLPVQT